LIGEKTTAAYNRGWIAHLQAGMPNFLVHEVPGHGHLATHHAPELLAGIILDFLEVGE
jgi:pimeloyl-ACP methyl ester carboxylesterase